MKREELTVKALYDLSMTIAAPLLERVTFPWEALPLIGDFIRELGATLSPEEYDHPAEDIWIHKSVKPAPTASLTGPLIICEGAQVRQCAFIRGNVIIGRGAVAGNSSEFKNSILFDKVETPHYNYVGDSILGFKAHMGAGSITSNIKSDRKNVVIHTGEEDIETGLRKIGAMLGDFAEVGCGSVMNPGAVIGRHSMVYPLTSVRGTVPADSIMKREGEIVKKV